jgi:hypothetical protein
MLAAHIQQGLSNDDGDHVWEEGNADADEEAGSVFISVLARDRMLGR